MIIPPEFIDFDLGGDIAILELVRSAPTTSLINVTQSTLPDGTDATVIGFGALFENGPLAIDLQQVDIPTVNQAQCAAALAPFGIDITADMICAGLPQGGKGSCQGDSGGPLFVQDPDGSFTQIGIVSFGVGCALPGLPGVYARPEALEEFLELAIVIEGIYRLSDSALTPNQRAVAAVLDDNRDVFTDDLFEVYVDLVLQLDPDRRASLDSLTPTSSFSQLRFAHVASDGLGRALKHRAVALQGGRPRTAFDASGLQVAGLEMRGLLGPPSVAATGGEQARCAAFLGGEWTHVDEDSLEGVAASEGSSGVVALGGDCRIGDGLYLGGAIGYGTGNTEQPGLSEVHHDMKGVTLFAVRRLDNGGYLSGNVGYTWLDFDSERHILLGENPRTATAASGGNGLLAGGEVGYRFEPNLRMTPFAGADYSRVEMDAYTERGAGGISLRVNPQVDTSLRALAGLRLQYRAGFKLPGTALVLVPSSSFAYIREFGDERAAVDAAFADLPAVVFRSTGTKRDREWFDASVGMDVFAARPDIAFGVVLRSSLGRDNIDEHSVSGRFTWRW